MSRNILSPAFISLFSQYLTLGDLIIDAGCNIGYHACDLADAGYRVIGVDARKEYLLQAEAHNEVQYVSMDVRQYVEDVICDGLLLSGILYHLDNPVKFLTEAASHVRQCIIINTHIATNEQDQEHNLSNMINKGGYFGRIYNEPQAHGWAAFGNAKSFWLTEESLFSVLQSIGFGCIQTMRLPRTEWLTESRRLYCAGRV